MNTIVLQKTYILYIKISDHVSRLPKIVRYSLGLAIDRCNLELLEFLAAAEHAEPVLKNRILLDANTKAEVLKLLLRVLVEKKLLKETNYFSFSSDLIEIGKMIGGWRKSLTK